jgi:hypothetical protein
VSPLPFRERRRSAWWGSRDVFSLFRHRLSPAVIFIRLHFLKVAQVRRVPKSDVFSKERNIPLPPGTFRFRHAQPVSLTDFEENVTLLLIMKAQASILVFMIWRWDFVLGKSDESGSFSALFLRKKNFPRAGQRKGCRFY